MSDLISRSALLKEIGERAGMWKRTAEVFCEVIEEQSTVEAVPVVHGEWILEEKAGVDYWCCSHCHKIKSEYYAKPKDNFCGHCGADMRTSAE